jgi:SAM-dependent methyltransferase
MINSRPAFKMTNEIRACAAAMGEKFGVSGHVSEYDHLLGYLIKNVRDPVKATEIYFSGGRVNASRIIARIQDLHGKIDSKSILEFAAGFGRVTRHLVALIPDATRLMTSDIHIEACETIRDELHVSSSISSDHPDDLRISGSFDFVFAFSFFSHMPHKSFGPWIAALYALVVPGGHLLITTHGDYARTTHPEFFGAIFDEAIGFGFRGESDQADIPSEQYGSAVVSNAYVERVLLEFAPGAEVLSHLPNVWFGLQDEWVIRRPSAL